MPRASGVLLHPTSLPDGRLGVEARRFVDWLEAAGQSWWQILPLGPPDASGSPYAAGSAFAGWSGLLAEPDAPVSPQEIEEFVATHPYWVGDWAAYSGGEAVADQVRFRREWQALREYAADRNVRFIGDLPIYVAPGGADHRAHPELFQRGVVAGVPPDDWSATGQLWGNPIYDWEAMRATGFRWWIERFRRTFELVDVTRIDHFRAFVAYWSVPERNRTARQGTWRRAPGRELLGAVRAALGDIALIAEDLGVITEPVERLRDDLRLPGMIVLQFAFSEGLRNPQEATSVRRNSDAQMARERLAQVHAGMIALSRHPDGRHQSHITAYAETPGETEASALYGTSDEIAAALDGVYAIGARHLLLHAGDATTQTIRQFATRIMPDFTAPRLSTPRPGT